MPSCRPGSKFWCCQDLAFWVLGVGHAAAISVLLMLQICNYSGLLPTILGLYREYLLGFYRVFIGGILGIYWGYIGYLLGFYRVFIGVI